MGNKLIELFKKITKSKNEVEIPFEWIENKEEEDVDSSTLAVDPIFIFETPNKRRKSRIQVPFKLKRILAFFLFLVSVGTVISTILFRMADFQILFFYIPYTIILLDYLGKTQPQKIMGVYHQLPDIEDLDQ